MRISTPADACGFSLQDLDQPSVVAADLLRLEEGAEKRHNNWYGTWTVRAVSADGRDEKLLVTLRSYLKIREFKTIVGLVSFLADMGATVVSIQLEEGGRVLHEAAGKPLASRA